MQKKRIHVYIEGLVQRVAFRAFTRDVAMSLGLAGWVRNTRDGRVEAVFEGDASQVDKMLAWCYEGSPYSRVERVEVLEEPYLEHLDRFEILYK